MPAIETTDLERELELIKENEQLPTEMNHHDVHHYTISYSTIGNLIVLFVILYFKIQAKGQVLIPAALSRPDESSEV